MVKGKTPKGKIKKNKLGVKKKAKKGKPRATPPTRVRSRRRHNVNNLGLDAEESLVEQALRGSPDMDKLLRENNGELYVPPDYPEGEGVAVAASAQPKELADIDKFLKMKKEYGEALTAEHALSLDKNKRSSRPPTPVVPFEVDMDEQDAETQREEADESLFNDFAGTTFDPKNYKNDFTFSFPGGKRKSRRRRKKSRRRRKKSRKRKTKRKSRRRRK